MTTTGLPHRISDTPNFNGKLSTERQWQNPDRSLTDHHSRFQPLNSLLSSPAEAIQPRLSGLPYTHTGYG